MTPAYYLHLVEVYHRFLWLEGHPWNMRILLLFSGDSSVLIGSVLNLASDKPHCIRDLVINRLLIEWHPDQYFLRHLTFLKGAQNTAYQL